jgi:tungstate transport system substrate-binding protein
LVIGLLVLAIFSILLLREKDSTSRLILVTTTSTQDSGLLDVLVPVFEAKTGYTVKPIAIGTGQSLAMGARGEADVALVHSPELEEKYLAQGDFINRQLVMFNHFIIVGPSADPAGVRSVTEASESFKQISGSAAPFVSRGDNSGTHFLEKELWRQCGIEPKGNWYIEAGQGMGATLMIASEKEAYALTDQATYLAFKDKVRLEPLLQGDPVLSNLYHVMEVNPTRFPKVNHAGARAFVEFLISAEAQEIIRSFGESEYASPLFYPAAAVER